MRAAFAQQFTWPRCVVVFQVKRRRPGIEFRPGSKLKNCSSWLDSEIALLSPGLVIPVGKLALAQFIEPVPALSEVIGQMRTVKRAGKRFDIIASLIPPELLLGIASSQEISYSAGARTDPGPSGVEESNPVEISRQDAREKRTSPRRQGAKEEEK